MVKKNGQDVGWLTAFVANTLICGVLLYGGSMMVSLQPTYCYNTMAIGATIVLGLLLALGGYKLWVVGKFR